MDVSLNKLLPVVLSLLLTGSLRAAPLPGNTGDPVREKQRQEAQQQYDRMTLEELERVARWVDVMPGEVTGASSKAGKPKAETRNHSQTTPVPATEDVLGSQFRDQVREVDRHSRRKKPVSGAGREADPVPDGADDDMVDYVLEMPAGNSAGKPSNKLKVKVRRGTMKVHQQIHELNKMLIDDVVRMGSLKAP